MSKVKIKIGKNPTEGYVEIDGNPIRCKSIKFEAGVGMLSSVTIVMNAEIELEGDNLAVIRDETAIGDEWKVFKHFNGEVK